MTNRASLLVHSAFLLLSSCSGQTSTLRSTALAPSTPVQVSSAQVPDLNAVRPIPPKPRRDPSTSEHFGRKLVDEYGWMRNKDAPEVLEHLRLEKAYTDAMTANQASLRQRLYGEILGRVRETDDDVPARDGAYLYYSRTEKGKQYPIHARSSLINKESVGEEILLDLNELGKTEAFVAIGPYEVSDDGKFLAYGLDTTGFQQYGLHIKDLTTRKVLPERIERVTSAAFAKDSRTLFYTVEDPTSKRSYQLHRHELGTAPSKDVLLYEEKDERFEVELSRTSSEKFILLTCRSHTTTEVRFVPADKPKDEFRLVEPRQQDHEYSVDHHGDEFVILTNGFSAPGQTKPINNRLVTAKTASPGKAFWKETIAHRPDVMLESVELFKDFAVVMERENGLRHLRVLDSKNLDLQGSHRIAIPETLSYVEWGDNLQFDESFVRFVVESPTTSATTYDYDPRKRSLELRKRVEVPNYDPSRYVANRFHAVANDGTMVPMTLLHRKDITANRQNPGYIYGYGAYGDPLFAEFSSEIFSLVDRGVVAVLAHVRGGGELGKAWHDAGRMQNKMNTFTDFVAVTESLIEQGWIAKDRIAIEGMSAGGLLMGAVTNMRPDLFRAVVAEVPFVDVIHTMLDEDLPLTVAEFEEWGNPKEKEQFGWMIQYSPYDNVTRRAYPAMLVNTSYNDSLVMYWEPAKWVAKLRDHQTNDAPVLLNINLEPAGHGGSSGRYEQMREAAFKYAWMLHQLGITDAP